MLIITINKKEKLQEVEDFMADEVLTNPHLNGATYKVELGDFVSIAGMDDYDGATLQCSIVDIIQN